MATHKVVLRVQSKSQLNHAINNVQVLHSIAFNTNIEPQRCDVLILEAEAW